MISLTNMGIDMIFDTCVTHVHPFSILCTHLCPFSKSKLNIWSIKSDRVNLVAPASSIECLLYLPNIRAIHYKLGPEKLIRIGNSNVLRLPVWYTFTSLRIKRYPYFVFKRRLGFLLNWLVLMSSWFYSELGLNISLWITSCSLNNREYPNLQCLDK